MSSCVECWCCFLRSEYNCGLFWLGDVRHLGELTSAESLKVYPAYLFPCLGVWPVAIITAIWNSFSLKYANLDLLSWNMSKVTENLEGYEQIGVEYFVESSWYRLLHWLPQEPTIWENMGGNCSITAISRKQYFSPQAGGCVFDPI